MDLVTGALLLAGAFNLLLAAIILFQAPRTRANLCYALLVICLLVWIAAIIGLRFASAPWMQFAALAMCYVAGLGIAVSFWYFAAFFTRRRVRAVVHVVLAGGVGSVTWLIWASSRFIQGIARDESSLLALDIGPHGWAFIVFFVAVMLDAFRVLVRHYRRSTGPERAQSLALLFGTVMTTTLGATFNVLLVQVGIADFIGWGPVTTIIMVAFIGYAIAKDHLMSIRLVTAELFTFGLILSLLLNFLISPNGISRLVEAVTLQLAIGFGTYLIRAALREAREREQPPAIKEGPSRLDKRIP